MYYICCKTHLGLSKLSDSTADRSGSKGSGGADQQSTNNKLHLRFWSLGDKETSWIEVIMQRNPDARRALAQKHKNKKILGVK